MTEVDYLKCKLEDTEKAFDRLHKKHMELLKQQGELEKENEQLRHKLSQQEMEYATTCYHLSEDYEQLKQKNQQLDDKLFLKECDIFDLKNENEQLKKDVDYWKQVASKNSDEINVLECENCIHRKGIVCDLDGGHIDFTSWCDYFEYKGDDKND